MLSIGLSAMFTIPASTCRRGLPTTHQLYRLYEARSSLLYPLSAQPASLFIPVYVCRTYDVLLCHSNAKSQQNISRLEALKKTMIARSNEVPARAAQESLRLLGSLEKDIPVIKALANEHLKDRHWWQVIFAPTGVVAT